MGEKTGISWCDATFNPWIGCTKVSQGCKFCYAETQNNHYQWNPAGWGPGTPRKRTSAANWAKPIQWAKRAVKDGVIRRVFCASLADVFDAEAPIGARLDLFQLIKATGEIGGLEWLILTKRPENIEKMMIGSWLSNPPDYIRLGVTAEDQENADKRISELLRVWKGNNFISYEPALGLVDFTGRTVDQVWMNDIHDPVFEDENVMKVNWIVCGGESGAGCRPMDLMWARSIRNQCADCGVPFFMKQLGGFPDKRHDPAGWPGDLRVQEFPKG